MIFRAVLWLGCALLAGWARANPLPEEIVFAVRQPGKDPHYYANFGYFAFDPERKAYGEGGKLCRPHRCEADGIELNRI